MTATMEIIHVPNVFVADDHFYIKVQLNGFEQMVGKAMSKKGDGRKAVIMDFITHKMKRHPESETPDGNQYDISKQALFDIIVANMTGLDQLPGAKTKEEIL